MRHRPRTLLSNMFHLILETLQHESLAMHLLGARMRAALVLGLKDSILNPETSRSLYAVDPDEPIGSE